MTKFFLSLFQSANNPSSAPTHPFFSAKPSSTGLNGPYGSAHPLCLFTLRILCHHLLWHKKQQAERKNKIDFWIEMVERCQKQA